MFEELAKFAANKAMISISFCIWYHIGIKTIHKSLGALQCSQLSASVLNGKCIQVVFRLIYVQALVYLPTLALKLPRPMSLSFAGTFCKKLQNRQESRGVYIVERGVLMAS